MLKRFKPKKGAIFVDIDGTLIEEVPDIRGPQDVKLLPWVGKSLAKLNKEFLIIAITNKSSVEKGYCSKENLLKIFKKLKEELITYGAKVDKIYFCPHREETNCKCRKPKAKFIFEALKKFKEIDLNESWLIGDRTRDIQLGINLKNLGYESFKTIGLLTGYRLKDNEFEVKPDFIAKNFLEVIKIIKTV